MQPAVTFAMPSRTFLACDKWKLHDGFDAGDVSR